MADEVVVEQGFLSLNNIRLEMLAHILTNKSPTADELRMWHRMVSNLIPDSTYGSHVLSEEDIDILQVRLNERI